uniref:Uncharacterized protein n=1 Tax=Bionectria ochroleuca TaxID=29856 RepID=A0A8H7TTC1_BIOOC
MRYTMVENKVPPILTKSKVEGGIATAQDGIITLTQPKQRTLELERGPENELQTPPCTSKTGCSKVPTNGTRDICVDSGPTKIRRSERIAESTMRRCEKNIRVEKTYNRKPRRGRVLQKDMADGWPAMKIIATTVDDKTQKEMCLILWEPSWTTKDNVSQGLVEAFQKRPKERLISRLSPETQRHFRAFYNALQSSENNKQEISQLLAYLQDIFDC